jgi:hypothetical protein
MRARYLFFSVCLASCLAVACSGDDDPGSSSTGGAGGGAGEPGTSGKAGSDGTGATSGTSGAGEPGAGGVGPGPGEGGAGGEAPQGFTDFVHELVSKQTKETNNPTSVNGRQFPDATDDHGHYLVPATDFDDLF